MIESKLYDVSPCSRDCSRSPVGPDSSMGFGVSVLVLTSQFHHSSSVSSEPLSPSVKRRSCLVWRVARIPWEGAEVHTSQGVYRGPVRLHRGSCSAAAVLSLQALWPSC